jgi:aspartate aminotransferase
MASASQSFPLTNRINRIEVSATMAVAAEATRLRAEGKDLVDFGAGEPHFATPQHIRDAAIAAVQANFSKYTPVNGTLELRKAIVERHAQDFGSNYQPEEAIAATGGKQALFNLFQVLIEHGDEVIIPVPYWVSFKDMVQYCGGIPVFVETDESKGFALTAEAIERAVTSRTKLIILNSPSNPAGSVLNSEDLTSIVRMARSKNIWVCSDECYVYLDYTGKRFSLGSLTGDKDRVVVVGSLSKTYAMTGWRLGFAMGPKHVINAMNKLQSQSTSNPTSITQKAAVAALSNSQQCVVDMVTEYIRLRDRMVAGLRSIPGVTVQTPMGAFYAYPNIGAYVGKPGAETAGEIAGRLLREGGVVTVPGEAFGTSEHLRCSYPITEQNIDKGIERMRKFFASL